MSVGARPQAYLRHDNCDGGPWPLRVDMFADELQPLLARLVAACRNASVQASSPRPHDLQQLDIFRLCPIAEARLGLALAASTKLLCVQAMTDLRKG